MNTGALILAAGAASRMGNAKMLLPYNGSTILAHIISEVQAINPVAISLVTGFFHEQIINNVPDKLVNIVYNKDWKQGMAGSIQTGLNALLHSNPDLKWLFIVASDQPFLERSILQEMIDTQVRTGKHIIAAEYKGIKGNPVLFHKDYFESIQKLSGDKGARVILQQHQDDMATVAFSLGEQDINTPEDYERFCIKLKEQDAERPIQQGS